MGRMCDYYMPLVVMFDTLVGSVLIFFFQAEDGIRDTSVTGVQTCALPIWSPRSKPRLLEGRAANLGDRRPAYCWIRVHRHRNLPADARGQRAAACAQRAARRSEERRVGKEWRTRQWPCQVRKKRDERAEHR